MAELRRGCELCEAEAAVYCSSDSAFLCEGCDEKVHCANFLVARHVRVRICPQCRTHAGNEGGFSGVGVPTAAGNMKVAACRSCSPLLVEVEDDCLSTSSSCVSSTGEGDEIGSGTGASSSFSSSSRKRNNGGGGVRSTPTAAVTVAAVDMKVEGILVNWCRRMEVEDSRVVKMAVELLGGCLGKMTVLPFRVMLATAFWVAIRLCCDGGGGENSTRQELRRLEQISGVPAKLIVATESRLARVIKRRQSREDHEEGWAEC